MKNHYIQAVIELIQSGKDPEVILKGLQNTMQQKGHMRLYGPVLRAVLRILQTKSETMQPTVVLAKESDAKKYATQIERALEALHASKDFSVTVDDTIIGGMVVKDKNTVIDQSYKTVLSNLYRSIAK